MDARTGTLGWSDWAHLSLGFPRAILLNPELAVAPHLSLQPLRECIDHGETYTVEP